MSVAVLFDFNGVLIDDEHVHARAMAEVLAPLGIALTEDEYFRELFVFDDRGAFEHMLKKHGRPHDAPAVGALVEQKKPVYLSRVASEGRFFPGGAALVAAAGERGVAGVVSGALSGEIELALRTLMVRERVSFIVAAEDTTRGKPDPEGYVIGRRLARDRGAERLVVVEDSPGGVAAARAAGLAACGVAHTVPGDELRDAGAAWVVERLDELSIDRLHALATPPG